MSDTINIKKAIQDAQQEHGKLLEALKGYEKTKLRVAQLESFINMGKALLSIETVAEASKPDVQLPLLPQEATPKPNQSTEASKDTSATVRPHKEGILEILTASGRALSLAEIAEEYRKRHWKLSERNSRQVLRGAVLRWPDVFTQTMKGNTAYYQVKQG